MNNAAQIADSPQIARRRLHQIVFLLAGLYNIGWGIFSSFDPQWLFRFAGMPEAIHPQIFACLAMVVGLYGLVYLEVARRPERGFALAAIGLIGKILGPIGLAVLISTNQWPKATFILCATNDLIWWIPFSLYLYDSWPFYRRDWEEGFSSASASPSAEAATAESAPSRGASSED